MIVQTFYAGLNFSSRNLLDSAAVGTFMSLTLGAATKLLDNMMVNYSESHTERAPQGKKVNSVEETSSLSDKIDAIILMLSNDRAHVDPNNVPLASLVAQEEHVDVSFIRNNNFNNSAYRNNFASNNYRPYPSTNGNGYGNSYGNSSNSTRGAPSELEVMLKDFIGKQTAFNKSVEEKLGKIDILTSKFDSLALDVELLKLKVLPNDVKESNTFAATNAIQVRIDENVRMLEELHARWEREDEMARNMKVCTITTSNYVVPNTINPLTLIVVEKTPTCAKKPKTAKTFSIKSSEIFRSIGDDSSISFNDFDVDGCNISEVILFLQKLALSPNDSSINIAFSNHITNALMKIREEKLKQKASIPKKLEDGWEPIIDMHVNSFDCHALCDLGASISVMPRKIYDMLGLPPLEKCYFDDPLADVAKKKPLGIINDVLIMVNNNLVPIDFLVMDVECNASCPIILGRLFLRTVGAVIDMKEGTIKCQFPLKKGMDHFLRRRKKLLFDSILRANYELDASSLDIT
jgi:hypothetical protein